MMRYKYKIINDDRMSHDTFILSYGRSAKIDH